MADPCDPLGAGVSHDVRTPLALILGWAEQLEQDALLPDSSRQKAAGIRTQCEKLRTLIDDLNLTSKLEYGAQPLRRKDLRAGPLFRQLVAQFCESPLAERCEITLEQEEPALLPGAPAPCSGQSPVSCKCCTSTGSPLAAR